MSAPEQHHHLPKSMSRLTLLGFGILISLMLVLLVNSVTSLRSQDELVNEIVEVRNKKIQLATDLLDASHNRHNSLVYQVFVEDPFEQDEHFQQYIKWGYTVGKARNDLRAMPLEKFEQDKLAEQDRLVTHIVDLHEQISDLARQGNGDKAQKMIATALRPFNLDFIDSVAQLQRYERERIQQALNEARQASRQAITLNLSLGSALLLLACGIALATYRQTSRHTHTIGEQLRALAETGQQLKHEASHDHLTGLPNRSLFYHRLNEAVTHARQENLKATVIYVDLDDFKPVNDQYGHALGDSLLQIVAGRLLKSVRATDTVARLGGDEFAIILLGVGEPDRISHIKEELRRNVSAPLTLDGIPLMPSCSCGHAVFPEDGDSMDTLLHEADTRMYEIKRRRKAA